MLRIVLPCVSVVLASSTCLASITSSADVCRTLCGEIATKEPDCGSNIRSCQSTSALSEPQSTANRGREKGSEKGQVRMTLTQGSDIRVRFVYGAFRLPMIDHRPQPRTAVVLRVGRPRRNARALQFLCGISRWPMHVAAACALWDRRLPDWW